MNTIETFNNGWRVFSHLTPDGWVRFPFRTEGEIADYLCRVGLYNLDCGNISQGNPCKSVSFG